MWRIELTTPSNADINQVVKARSKILPQDGLVNKAGFLVASWMESVHDVHLEPDPSTPLFLAYSGVGKSMPDIHVKACDGSSAKSIGGMTWTFNEDSFDDSALIACVYMHGWSSNVGYLTAQTWAIIRTELTKPGSKWTPPINRRSPNSLVSVEFKLTEPREGGMVPA